MRDGIKKFVRILLLPIRFFWHSLRLLFSAWNYRKTGKNKGSDYQSMIHLFCITGGISNDILSRYLKHPEQPFGNLGLLGDLSADAIGDHAKQLKEKGFIVFPDVLNEEVCGELINFALSTSGVAMRMDDQVGDESSGTIYNRATPQATRFSYSTEDLVGNHAVQRLMADHNILSIAQAYLGGAPIMDIVTMWWSSAYKNEPDKEAAQFWHFDMDRPRWLKFFFYLTDVDADSGPHSFVAGSHRNGGIPFGLRSKGYARLTDMELFKYFNSHQIIEHTGKRGTLIIEDTRGLHKGKHVMSGDRLLLQFEFCTSLFGGVYKRCPRPNSLVPELERQMKATPDVYSLFSSQDSDHGSLAQ